MSQGVNQDVLVNPFAMLLVQYEELAYGQLAVAVVTCRYVPVRLPNGLSRVAVELVYDPDLPLPLEPYYCPRGRLVRRLIAPARVKLVKSFMTYPPSEHLGFVIGPHGDYYSQHFHGENEGAAVITGPTAVGGTELVPVPEVYREPAVNADDARIKLAHWRQSQQWPA